MYVAALFYFYTYYSGSEFSTCEIELRNRVTQNGITLRVTKSKIFIEFFFRVTNSKLKIKVSLRVTNLKVSTLNY